jgi:hypothetical protein
VVRPDGRTPPAWPRSPPAVAAILVWRVFAPAGTHDRTLSGADVLDVPRAGEVAPVFLADGRPVFIVHHGDGTVSVVDAFSSHVQYGLKDLVAWCPSTRHFVEVAHEARYDEFGNWHSAGPATSGLATFAFEVVERDTSGDPSSIRVGAIRFRGSAPDRSLHLSTVCPEIRRLAQPGRSASSGNAGRRIR